MASTNSIRSSDLNLNSIDHRPDAYRLVDTESEDFAELCDSISQFGVLHPILVRPVKERYEILSGHRRFVASRHLGLSSIPCRILPVKNELAEAIIEFATNAVRSDPKPCEYGRAVASILARLGGETKLHQLCAIVNKGPTWIRDRLTLLTLHPTIQEDVDNNRISIGAGVILSKVSHQVQLKMRNLARDLPAKKLAALVRDQRLTSVVTRTNLGCTTKQRNYQQDFTIRGKKELGKALDDPYLVEYACSEPFTPDEARVAREVLHWVCKLDPESIMRRRQQLEARRVGEKE